MRKRFNKRKNIFVFVLLLISIGFASLATNLYIKGKILFKKPPFDIHFDNLVVNMEGTAPTSASITADDTIDFSVTLSEPGDYFEFDVDVVNAGTIDGMVSSIDKIFTVNGEEVECPEFAKYTVAYVNDRAIEKNHKLAAGEKVGYKVRVSYVDDADTSKISLQGDSISFRLKANFAEADENAVVIPYVCKRATTLHTEECTRSSDNCVAVGYSASGSKGTATITYGNLGTAGEVPKAGDAYDCDVDNSGTFDEDERFYYVSDSGTNDGYATLIYYTNVAIEKYYSKYFNYYGPTVLLDKLPSNEEWTNTGLNTNMTRQLLNEKGVNTSSNGSKTLPNFTYENRATRLLTTQEIESACGISMSNRKIGDLDSCEYLLENTDYATSSGTANWWLETPVSSGDDGVWSVNSNSRFVYGSSPNFSYGVRPAIEVKHMDIEY